MDSDEDRRTMWWVILALIGVFFLTIVAISIWTVYVDVTESRRAAAQNNQMKQDEEKESTCTVTTDVQETTEKSNV